MAAVSEWKKTRASGSKDETEAEASGHTGVSELALNLSLNRADSEQQSQMQEVDEDKDEHDNASEEDLDSDSSFESEGDEVVYKKNKRSNKKKPKNEPFKCSDCPDLEFTLKNDLYEHLAAVHKMKVRIYKPPKTKREKRIFTCDVCNAVFHIKGAFINHMKNDHKIIQAFKCSDCDVRFTGLRNLQGHYYRVHKPEGTKYPCTQCPKVFYVKTRLTRHMESHKEKPPVCTICAECGIDFRSKQALSQHMSMSHEVVRPFICECCAKTFSKLPDLKRHLNKHTMEEKFECTHCDKVYFSTDELRKHEQRAHSNQEFKCELCSKKLRTFKSLQSHVKIIHLKEPTHRVKRYKCDACDLMFQSPGLKVQHFRSVHMLERPFTCHLCGKTFGFQNLLNRHLDVHYEVKKYQCPHCKKSFSQKSNMNMHARTHTGEKPYKCSVCDKGFTQSSNLKTHMKNHRRCNESSNSSEQSDSPTERETGVNVMVSRAADLGPDSQTWQELSKILVPDGDESQP